MTLLILGKEVGVSDKMLTLLTLGSEGGEKSGVGEEIKRKCYI